MIWLRYWLPELAFCAAVLVCGVGTILLVLS